MLSQCSGRQNWPKRGVYFFFEAGQKRSDSGSGLRVVRVGTHALTASSRTTLWNRLAQHRGQAASGGGNHRGSIFRLIVGTSLMQRDNLNFPTWGAGSSASAEVRAGESELESRVSEIIGRMPFLWLDINDTPGDQSKRGEIERNAIALLSNFEHSFLDPPSDDWLGLSCDRIKVRQSGLWNSNHVDDVYNPAFLNTLESLVDQTENAS